MSIQIDPPPSYIKEFDHIWRTWINNLYNKVNDYEEGDWTPVLTSTGATFTATTFGSYTKIGRMVYLTFSCTTTAGATGTLTNPLTISGLPYPSANVGFGFAGSVGYLNNVNFPAGALQLTPRVTQNSSQITLDWAVDDSPNISMTAADFDAITARLAITVVYST